ncbi:MAG: 50S ribosomal protein L3, partial [Spirochaetia bacterium]|nr:50S ribosomal protein L3 [Spirochaetia bacterium]
FAGAMKRHGFAGGPSSHGSMQHRAVGSIGSNTYPAHVWKGKKMAGRMGGDNVTIQNLRVVKVDADNKYVLIRGAVPGANNGLIHIKKAVKKK